MDFLLYLLRFVMDFVLFYFLYRLFVMVMGAERNSRFPVLEEGDAYEFRPGGVLLVVRLVSVQPASISLDCTFIRGEGMYAHQDRLEVNTKESPEFQVFPTPNFPWKHQFLVRGRREGDKVRLVTLKKDPWKIPFFGGEGYT